MIMLNINRLPFKKVSVIVPVYNVEKYIVRCLKSIVDQTISESIELIVVDDCGSDNSILLAESFLSEQSALEYQIIHHRENRGLSAARNTGLQAATGDYVYFLDSDDTITEDCIESLVNPLKYHAYDVVLGDFRTVGGTTECKLWLPKGEVVGNKLIFKDFAENKWYAMAVNKLYSRSFLCDNLLQFKEGIIHEDELWSFYISLCAESLYVETTVTYNYYINPGSIMSNMAAKRHFNSWAVILKEMVQYAKIKGRYNDIDVFYYIELLKINFTCEAYRILDKEDFGEYYDLLAKGGWNPLKDFFNNRLTIKRLLKDLCFYLPSKLGRFYLCTWYKLTLKDMK